MSKYPYQKEMQLSTKVDSFDPRVLYAPRSALPPDLTDSEQEEPENSNEIPQPDPKLQSRILIDTVHDGFVIPGMLSEPWEAAKRAGKAKASENHYQATFFEGRDWGASHVANAIAWKLGLSEFYETLPARNVLDFNRFPGVNRTEAAHLEHYAVSGRVVPDILKYNCSEELLRWYRTISDNIEAAIHKTITQRDGEKVSSPDQITNGRFIRLSIHTFDKDDGKTGRRRPKVSIVHRSDVIERTGRLPANTFHHLYPPSLAAFTGDRLLKSALSSGFETHYIPEHSDHPYMHPEGGVDMRLQAWIWFIYLRLVFEQEWDKDDLQRLQRLGARKKEKTGYVYDAYWKALANPNALHPATRLIRSFVDKQIIERSFVTDEHGRPINLAHIWKIENAVTSFWEQAETIPRAEDVPWFVFDYQYVLTAI